MRLKALVFIAMVVVLISATCLPSLASDWDSDDASWSDAGSDWETEAWDWDDTGWSWVDEAETTGSQDLASRIATGQAVLIPEYPGAVSGLDTEADEPVNGRLRSVHVTEDSAIRAAGYYQWKLGMVPVEIRPYQYVIQIEDQETGLFTIIVIQPWSDGLAPSSYAALVGQIGARIEVIDADSPHESLSAGVGRLVPADSGAAFEDFDLGSSMPGGMDADPSDLLSMMMLMMMGGSDEDGWQWDEDPESQGEFTWEYDESWDSSDDTTGWDDWGDSWDSSDDTTGWDDWGDSWDSDDDTYDWDDWGDSWDSGEDTSGWDDWGDSWDSGEDW